MAAPRKTPTETTLRRWYRKGMTFQEMSDRWFVESGGIRVTKQGMYMACDRYGFGRRNVRSGLPWKPNAEHTGMHDHCMAMHYQSRNKGKKLPERTEDALNGWLRTLEKQDAVLAYKPNTIQGWYHVKRLPGEKGIFRIPKERARKVVPINRKTA